MNQNFTNLELSGADLRTARLKANNLTTTSLYTQARKMYLLNQLDAAIALI